MAGASPKPFSMRLGERTMATLEAHSRRRGETKTRTAGAGDADAWPSGSEAPLSPELISQAHRRLRYRVLPTP